MTCCCAESGDVWLIQWPSFAGGAAAEFGWMCGLDLPVMHGDETCCCCILQYAWPGLICNCLGHGSQLGQLLGQGANASDRTHNCNGSYHLRRVHKQSFDVQCQPADALLLQSHRCTSSLQAHKQSELCCLTEAQPKIGQLVTCCGQVSNSVCPQVWQPPVVET